MHVCVCVREIIKEICSVLSAVDKILTLAASLCVGGVLKYKYTPGSALVATELKPSFNRVQSLQDSVNRRN